MTKENPPAPETGGQTNDVVSEAQNLRTEDAAGKSDEELRHFAVARLAEYLDIGASLVARCEHLAELPKGDRLGPIYAAARMMRANAQVAEALARVAHVEIRRRSIVERIQPRTPTPDELNSKLKKETEEQDSAFEELERRLDALAQAALASRIGERDGVGDEHEEEEVAPLVRRAEKNAG
jgi:hypothetical protein